MFMLLCACPSARADSSPGVVLWETPALRPGLCAALRIQSAGVTGIACPPDEQSAAPLSQRIAWGAERLRALGGSVGVLLEHDPHPGLLRMYVLTSRADRAVLSIEAIAEQPDRDVDRGLALKILEVFEQLEAIKASSAEGPSLAAALAPSAVPSTRESAPTTPLRASRTYRGFAEAGAGMRTGNDLVALVRVLLGLGVKTHHLRFDVGLGADIETHQQVLREGRRVRVAERGPLLEVRLVRELGRIDLGAAFQARWALAAAEGWALDGTRGKQTVNLGYLGLGVDMRVPLTSRLWLRIAPSVEVSLVDQRYEVDRMLVVATKAARFTLPLLLGFDGIL